MHVEYNTDAIPEEKNKGGRRKEEKGKRKG